MAIKQDKQLTKNAHRPVALLDAVLAHDVEDAHADIVTVTAAYIHNSH
jgi:hypothetical protein